MPNNKERFAQMKIQLIQSKSGYKFRTLETIVYNLNAIKYTIPKGYISDGMSVPRLLWRLLEAPISGKTARSSVKHDYGYEKQYATRKEVDRQYLADLIMEGLAVHRAVLVYYGLRLFGWIAWKKCGKSIPNKAQ